MDRYTKTSSVSSENQDTKEAGNIYVKSGSKIRNIISQAHKILQNKEEKKINLIGSGPSISKTITCAEIVKRKARGLHQLNALYYTKVEDTWEPKEESLDKLLVTRRIPAISITLSKTPLDATQPGYQAPGKSKSPVQFGDEDWNYLGKMILQRNPRKHQMDMLRRCQKV
ncbi:PREDICTED: ribonuclease P protein subunit p25-like protein isoform X1 [Acropora digitifera]|uniref:ribonuclease P protein subunit p25-like protein isoform X1 n=1 Tax=Acropora digitifera TaxID=70779 RepID=UPI000779F51F|nr:PREDICTED: ribonuclease P protein subunit p25-like protein isoform X1 [Acropora digitifera]